MLIEKEHMMKVVFYLIIYIQITYRLRYVKTVQRSHNINVLPRTRPSQTKTRCLTVYYSLEKNLTSSNQLTIDYISQKSVINISKSEKLEPHKILFVRELVKNYSNCRIQIFESIMEMMQHIPIL